MVAVQSAPPGVSSGRAAAVPRLSLLASPQVHPSAQVHEFSFLEGDVHVGAGAMVAPGTAVTAASGASVVLGEECSLLPGVALEGLAGAQVTAGASSSSSGGASKASSCSIWLGDRSVVAHKSIIHSPAFIGDDCFIGFRSTVFNARLGAGCVVMMHALVQDVEVPPGKCVPSGSVITSQHQADQLPNVRAEDLEFVREVTGSVHGGRSTGASQKKVSRNARGPSASATANKRRSKARLIPVNSPPKRYSSPDASSAGRSSGPRQPAQTLSNHSSYATEGAHMQATRTNSQRLAPEIVQQVRQYLSQGYRIGMEHASQRRYRSGVWETCPPIKDTREQAVFEGLERCLAEHTGEFVRIFGIDAKAKRRVGMVTVQRPDGQPVSIDTKSVPASSNGNGYASNSSYAPSNNGSSVGASGGGLTPDVVQQVRNLLRGGFVIGTEHADARRFRSNVWKSCSPIQSSNEQEVLSRLEHCLAEHMGEYVRMFGIDTQAKRRLSSVTIQRADGQPVVVSPTSPTASASSSQGGGGYAAGGVGAGSGGGEAAQAVNQILAQGNQVGVEIADARRFRSGIWQTAPSVQSASQLQAVLSQNADKYVRIFGVNKAMKTRGAAVTIQKPGQSASSQPAQSPAPGGAQSASTSVYNSAPPAANGTGEVTPEVMNQVTQLVNQGCRIALEFADKRRYRSGIWQTGPSIESRRPADAIAALGQQLAQHAGDYVRLVGVDPQAKRRVLEATIQRP